MADSSYPCMHDRSAHPPPRDWQIVLSNLTDGDKFRIRYLTGWRIGTWDDRLMAFRFDDGTSDDPSYCNWTAIRHMDDVDDETVF